ncbi:MAG: adenylosuccinate lyase [Fidelibacterota bacterium]
MTSVVEKYNISPLDDRYRKELEELIPYVSEFALNRTRVRVEIEYLIALTEEKGIAELPPLQSGERKRLRSLFLEFSPGDFQAIKKTEDRIGHDVKAVEYFLRRKLTRLELGKYGPWIHYALTSEDINNLAYGLMWQEALSKVYIPHLERLHDRLKALARRYKDLSILALTHGQPATPTSLGKEFAVFHHRLDRQLGQLSSHTLEGKLSGASGTWSAHTAGYPRVHWFRFTRRFVSSLNLEPTLFTTQISTHDSLAESCHMMTRVNTILIDLSRDLWLYISRGTFRLKPREGEVGSSTMPHKVNPIHFENAEGNAGLAVAYCSHLAQTLPVSRLQRDLSGSTVIRNQGVAIAHSLLAVKNILKGLETVEADEDQIRRELNSHWEILAEAVQTILRKRGEDDPYERLRSLTRGKTVSRESMTAFIEDLDLPEEDKRMLLSLTPETYTGLASKVVDAL